MFEGLRDRIEQFLAQHTRPPDPRAHADLLYQAVLEARVGVGTMRDALADTERELVREQQHHADAERRGRMARNIQDAETAEVAERFVQRHANRIGLLTRKVAVQHEELQLAGQELEQLTVQLREVRRGIPGGASEAAWRDIEAAGGTRPDTDLAAELLGHDLDRSAREAAAEAQLAHLKRKLGKDRS